MSEGPTGRRWGEREDGRPMISLWSAGLSGWLPLQSGPRSPGSHAPVAAPAILAQPLTSEASPRGGRAATAPLTVTDGGSSTGPGTRLCGEDSTAFHQDTQHRRRCQGVDRTGLDTLVSQGSLRPLSLRLAIARLLPPRQDLFSASLLRQPRQKTPWLWSIFPSGVFTASPSLIFTGAVSKRTAGNSSPWVGFRPPGKTRLIPVGVSVRHYL